MTYLYGHKFTSVFGESAAINGKLTEVAQTWASALQGLTGEQLADGLRACVNSGDAWPPSVPEFVGMCKGSGVNEFGLSYIPEYYHDKNRITDRSRLLSNDERDTKRQGFSANLNKLANELRAKNGRAKKNPTTDNRNPDKHDYLFMSMLLQLRDDTPNIVDRINITKPGSFNNV